MKKKQKILTVVILTVSLLAVAFIYQAKFPTDRCTSKDIEINNCVPAGKCGPTPATDAVIDCNAKHYDKKFNTEL